MDPSGLMMHGMNKNLTGLTRLTDPTGFDGMVRVYPMTHVNER